MVHKWHDKEVPEAWDGSEVDGFWMMVLGRWLRLSQVYDLWLIYAFLNTYYILYAYSNGLF